MVVIPYKLALIKVNGCNSAAGIVTFIGAGGRKLTRERGLLYCGVRRGWVDQRTTEIADGPTTKIAVE